MAQFTVSKDKKGQFRFELIANNGETIAVSESYKAKPSALKTIEKIKAQAKGAKVVDLTVAAKPAAKPAAKKPAKKAAPKKAAKKVAKKPAAKKAAPAPAPAAPATPAPAPAAPAPEAPATT
jgi:uncharacterized protein YegP (UPF0339 family)